MKVKDKDGRYMMKVNSIKDISPGSQLPKKLLAIVLSLVIIVCAFMLLNNTGRAARDTVDVVRVKNPGGIPAKSVISKNDLEVYGIISKEFSQDMVTDMEEAIGNYSTYYLRNKTVLYKDQFSSEKPMKNEWLYTLDKSGEVLTIPYSYLECGGDILTPGDVVKIRVAYDEAQPEQNAPGQNGAAGDGRIIAAFGSGEKIQRKVETLFDQIKVKDLLNAGGHSIYEVYKEVQKLSEDRQQQVMKSKEFLENILPRSLVLEGSTAQVDAYAKYKSKKDISFTITILSRAGNTEIMDQLPTVAKEIESWIPEKE